MSLVTNSIERSNALPIVKVTYDIIFSVTNKVVLNPNQVTSKKLAISSPGAFYGTFLLNGSPGAFFGTFNN